MRREISLCGSASAWNSVCRHTCLTGSMRSRSAILWTLSSPHSICSMLRILSNLKKMREWDTLAHLDYIIRYIPGQGDSVYDSMARHSEIIDEILRYVISCGKCLEVNTAGYKYGFLQPHPALAILRRYYALGGRLLTRSVGFTGYCIFEGRRMREIPF